MCIDDFFIEIIWLNNDIACCVFAAQYVRLVVFA